MASLVTGNYGKIVPLVIHIDDELANTPLSNSFDQYFTCGGVPTFFVGDVETSSFSQINTICSQSPVAQSCFIITKNFGLINVKTRTRFFKEVTGDYYLSVYVIESNINGGSGTYQQSGGGSDFKHDYVLRAANTPSSAFGELISSGSAGKGKIADKEYDIPVGPITSADNLSVITVIWQKTGTTYKFVNAYK